MDKYREYIKARNFLLENRSDYNYCKSHFEWPLLTHFNWALDYFDVMAKDNTRIALWQVDEYGKEKKFSFSEISTRSSQCANYLKSRGVVPGDAVFFMVDDDVVLWEMMLACMKLGMIMIPNNPYLHDQEIQERFEAQKVKVLVTSRKFTTKFDVKSSELLAICIDGEAAGWVNYMDVYNESSLFVPDRPTAVTEPLLKFFTTSHNLRQEFIEHTYGSFTIGHLATMYWMGVQPGDVHLGISSTGFTIHAWSSFIAPWSAEATVFLFKEARFNAYAVLDAITKYPITSFLASPTVWNRLSELELENYPNNLRELLSTGDLLKAEVIAQVFTGWGKFIRDGYSMTETPIIVGVPPEFEDAYGSMGVPMPGFTVKLINEDGDSVDHGMLCVKIIDGFWGLEKNLKEGVNLFEGHFITGDVAYRDDRQNYNFDRRNDAIFKSSGYRISPYELEYVLKGCPSVRDVVVIPSADPTKDSVPKAIVTLAKGYTPTKELALDILNFSKNKLSGYKRIRKIEFADLPKDFEGNILRTDLISREREKIRSRTKDVYEFWEDDFKISVDQSWSQDFP